MIMRNGEVDFHFKHVTKIGNKDRKKELVQLPIVSKAADRDLDLALLQRVASENPFWSSRQ